MIIDTRTLEPDERVYLELRALYEENGYRQFRMRKFEEYSLYLENKKFLGSEYVITFNAPSGKLLALKPDVTLSIVKNAKASGKTDEKLYYRESVYRLGEGGGFKEISQMGLERIGDIGENETVELCFLAMKSLAVVDENYVFAVSDMSFIGGLLDDCAVTDDVKNNVLGFIRARNSHELSALCDAEGISDLNKQRLLAVCGSTTEFGSALKVAAEAAKGNAVMESAVATLSVLYEAAKQSGTDGKMRLDFSILNDIDYYNGIIFQGFVAGMPRFLLTGGRYDRLLQKFKKKGAMGFALSLSDVAAYYPKEKLC